MLISIEIQAATHAALNQQLEDMRTWMKEGGGFSANDAQKRELAAFAALVESLLYDLKTISELYTEVRAPSQPQYAHEVLR